MGLLQDFNSSMVFSEYPCSCLVINICKAQTEIILFVFIQCVCSLCLITLMLFSLGNSEHPKIPACDARARWTNVWMQRNIHCGCFHSSDIKGTTDRRKTTFVLFVTQNPSVSFPIRLCARSKQSHSHFVTSVGTNVAGCISYTTKCLVCDAL